MEKPLTDKELTALRFIRNHVVHFEKSPPIRKVMEHLKYQSPHSASLIIESLLEKGYLAKIDGSSRKLRVLRYPQETAEWAETTPVPLVGSVACGSPILATESIEAMIPVSRKLIRPQQHYFLLRAKGDSMTEVGINDGDYVLVQQQAHAENGDIVVALINNEATIKEFYLENDTVYLLPRSRNPHHQPIILTGDLIVQGRVVKVLPTPKT